MPSTVEDASSETEKLGHNYIALHDKGVRVNEMGIEKSRGKETGMTDTRPCVHGGQEREKRGYDPSTPTPPLTEIHAKGIFPGKYHVLYCHVLGNFIKNF